MLAIATSSTRPICHGRGTHTTAPKQATNIQAASRSTVRAPSPRISAGPATEPRRPPASARDDAVPTSVGPPPRNCTRTTKSRVKPSVTAFSAAPQRMVKTR